MADALIIAKCDGKTHEEDERIASIINERVDLGVKRAYTTEFNFRNEKFCIAVEAKGDEEAIKRIIQEILSFPRIVEIVPFTAPVVMPATPLKH